MALLRTPIPHPTQLSSTKHHAIITNYFDLEKKKKKHYSLNPSFHCLSITHTPTLIITTKQHSSYSTSQQQQTQEFSTTRLLAQNVPWSSTTEDIRSLFEKYGKVLDVEVFFLLLCLIMFNSFQASSIYLSHNVFFCFCFGFKLSMYNKNRNRGLAFVEMGSSEEASAALDSLQSYVCQPNINVYFIDSVL